MVDILSYYSPARFLKVNDTIFLYPQVAVLQRFTETYDIWALIWIIYLSKILYSKKMSKSPTSNQNVDYGVSFS